MLARKIISQNVYEKLHNKFTSTYSRGILKRREAERFRFDETRTGATAAAHRTKGDDEQINVCFANKSFLNISTRDFHYIDCFSPFFPSFHLSTFPSRPDESTTAPLVALFKSGSRYKKCTLTISIYAKHIIALCMITIFRNLSSKLRH